MCVIAFQPAGERLPKKNLDKMMKSNPDGFGLAFISPEDKKIHYFKSLDEKKFTKRYRDLWSQFGKDTDFMIHARIATHGSITVENCHPFLTKGAGVMAHNGVISNSTIGKSKADKVDTVEFIEHIVNKLPRNWLDKPAIVELVENYIGYSKLVFMTKSSKLKKSSYILNERLGTWDKDLGIWFSNGSYKVPKPIAVNPKYIWTPNQYKQQKSKYTPFFGMDDQPKSGPSWWDKQQKETEEKEKICKKCGWTIEEVDRTDPDDWAWHCGCTLKEWEQQHGVQFKDSLLSMAAWDRKEDLKKKQQDLTDEEWFAEFGTGL